MQMNRMECVAVTADWDVIRVRDRHGESFYLSPSEPLQVFGLYALQALPESPGHATTETKKEN